jgi:tetraacyldisaccharide 4'-kinase
LIDKDRSESISALFSRRILVVSGIGNPESFERQLVAAGATVAGSRRFGDHHRYTQADLEQIGRLSASTHAEAIVTTEKDWVKLAGLVKLHPLKVPIWRVSVRVKFAPGHETALLDQIMTHV